MAERTKVIYQKGKLKFLVKLPDGFDERAKMGPFSDDRILVVHPDHAPVLINVRTGKIAPVDDLV